MTELENSVGQGGVNLVDDVRMVQSLLNANLALLAPAVRLVEDGLIGAKTIGLITEFQQRVVQMVNPDGRIDPGGRTWQALLPTSQPPRPAPVESPARPNRPAQVEAFIQQTLPAAREVKVTWGVPVSVCIAQAALESAWGQVVKGNAYFGIKGKSLSGSSTDFTTSEFVQGEKITIQDTFRAYQDFAEAADDYGRFLSSNPRYANCFTFSDDPLKFADALQAAHYATDPNYAEKVKRIIGTYDLQELEV